MVGKQNSNLTDWAGNGWKTLFTKNLHG
jgi:hypothetical protein